jgi:hypothetical protein
MQSLFAEITENTHLTSILSSNRCFHPGEKRLFPALCCATLQISAQITKLRRKQQFYQQSINKLLTTRGLFLRGALYKRYPPNAKISNEKSKLF